ncbi:MAG: hypothetical protein MZV70_35635 [Desulfobacterales bacterium]|nr:hypothetical protein [Desulfobacterales bacterium]
MPSPAAGQAVELKADRPPGHRRGPAETYPLQKKTHSLEFLREIAHLRPVRNTFGAVARMRNQHGLRHPLASSRSAASSYVHTPIITASDCEGAGRDVPGDHPRPRRPAAQAGKADGLRARTSSARRPT